MRLGIGIIDYLVGNRAGRRVRSLFEAIIWTWFSENIDLVGRESETSTCLVGNLVGRKMKALLCAVTVEDLPLNQIGSSLENSNRLKK